MKTSRLLFVFLLTAACGFLMTQSMYDIVRAVGDYSLVRVVKYDSLTGIERLCSGNVPLFMEFGADSCMVAEYGLEDERYKLEIVSFASRKGALGAYAESDLPDSYPVELGDGGRRNDRMIQFVKGRYVVSVQPSKTGTMTGASNLAGALSGRIETRGIAPDIYAGLPRSSVQGKIIERSERFFMGPIVFKKYFGKKLSDVLMIENIRMGLAAEYETDDGTVKFLKLRYPAVGPAKAAVNSYVKSRADRPVILPRQDLQYFTIVERNRRESYIADYAEWVYFMPATPVGKKSRGLFEYILRGGK